jgi:signal recognition particle receptor subunit beta
MIARALRRYWREALFAALLVLPWLALLPLGILWLREHHALLEWTIGMLAAGLLAWPIRHAMRARVAARLAEDLAAHRAPAANAAERAARKAVEAIAEEAPKTDPLDQQAMLALARRTMEAVAGCLHPGADNPAARVTLPEALLLTETVARDLRAVTLRYLPGARSLRLDHALRAQALVDRYGAFGRAAAQLATGGYRLWRVYTDPGRAVPAEIARRLDGSSESFLMTNLRETATRTFVREVGRHAIELYAGRLRLSAAELAGIETPGAPAPQPEPARIVLVGQVNAGKSSLLNALAGSVLAEVRAIPATAAATTYDLLADDETLVRLVDTPGLTAEPGTASAALQEIEGADAAIWVVSATQPARQPDLTAFAAFRARQEAEATRREAPFFIALTHVDQLRPAAEWSPPYDPVQPRTPKERSIRDAVVAVADAFQVPPEQVVPVALPEGGEAWNQHLVWGHIGARMEASQLRRLDRLRAARGGSTIGEMAGQIWRLLNKAVP